MNNQLKQQFGRYFLNGEFEKIYENTSDSFQKIVSITQFKELSTKFNAGVNGYRCMVANSFQGLDQYIWIDESESKAVVVALDDKQVN